MHQTTDQARSAMTADFSVLWRWVKEREAIRQRRARGEPSPWTTDPILRDHRFCNVRREDDRVTAWIRTHVRERFASHPYLWLMLCICRQINWPDTIVELIGADGAWPVDANFDSRRMTAVLAARKARGDKVYTGAYIISAPAVRGADKGAYVSESVIGDLWRRRDEFADWRGRTLQDTHARIRRSAGWGDFLSYQAVVDMRFTRLLSAAPDISTWAAAGPGTLRGLNRVHGRPVDAALSQVQALDEIRSIHGVAELTTGVPMDLSDVPNILCEVDKYLRVFHDEGRPRARFVPGRGY